MKRRCVIDEGVGETRAAVYEGRQLVEVYVRRWSDANMPRFQDRFFVRIKNIDQNLSAAFVDMGHGHEGFLRFTDSKNAPRFREGQKIEVKVTREAEPGKYTQVQFVSMADEASLGPVLQLSLQDMIAQRFSGDVTFEFASVSSLVDAVGSEIASTRRRRYCDRENQSHDRD